MYLIIDATQGYIEDFEADNLAEAQGILIERYPNEPELRGFINEGYIKLFRFLIGTDGACDYHRIVNPLEY